MKTCGTRRRRMRFLPGCSPPLGPPRIGALPTGPVNDAPFPRGWPSLRWRSSLRLARVAAEPRSRLTPPSERRARIRRRGGAGPRRHPRRRGGDGRGGVPPPPDGGTSGRPVVAERWSSEGPAATPPAAAAALHTKAWITSVVGAPPAADPSGPAAAPSGGAQEHRLGVEQDRGTAAAARPAWHRGWHLPPPPPRSGGGGDYGPPPPWHGGRGVPFPAKWPLTPCRGSGGASPHGRSASAAAAQSMAGGGARGGGGGGCGTPRAARPDRRTASFRLTPFLPASPLIGALCASQSHTVGV